ncbi:MAG: dienelactone hydrolase family protein [Bdellovibrionota bacterium]
MNQQISRREFVGAGIGAGFALAVQPVSAWAVLTSGEGLVSGTVSIPTANGSLPAYRAMPSGKGPFPVVLVIHEIFGVHEYIQDVCRRLAKLGYLAICPNLCFRHGDVTKIADIQRIISEVVSKVPQSEVLSDLDSVVTWLPSHQGDVARLGITGFCWGGGVTWMYCAHNPSVKAGVAWYGPLTGPASTDRKFPVDIAPELKVPVLGLYGGKDARITEQDREKMREGLKKGKSGSEIVVYPDAEHGFHADYRPSYNEKDAIDGWKRLLAWFNKNGVRK